MLSLGIGALQMMLDRGETNDWFGSTETWIELGLTIAGFWVFIVHAATAEHPFVSLALFKDRNFVAGIVLMFLIGVLLYGTLALLPPLLQELMNYPVMTTGLVLAPRGIGTLVAMAVVGRLTGRIDARLILAVRLRRHRLFAVAHDRLLARHGHVAGDLDHHPAGLRARPRLGSAQHRLVRDPAGALPHRGLGLQLAGAQYRRQRRHRHRRERAGAQHPGQPRRARRACEPLQPDAAACRR